MADRRVRAIFEVQVTQAERGMKSLAGEVEKADKKVDALGKTLDGLGKKRTRVEIEADIQDAEMRVSELEAHLDDLRAMDVTPEVRADTEKAKADLSEVKAELRDLYGESAEVQVTADTSRAESALDGAQGRLDAIDGDTATVHVVADTGDIDGVGGDIADTIADDFEDSGDPLGDAITGKLMDLASGAALAGIGTLIGQGLAKYIIDGMDRELQLSQIEASTFMDEATAERIGAAAGQAMNVGFQDAVREGYQTIGEQLFRGGLIDTSTDQAEIEALMVKVEAMNRLFGMDTTETINAVSRLYTSGLAPSATAAFDLITAAQKGMLDDQMVDSLIEYSTQWADAGITADQALGLMKQGLDSGAMNVDKVSDAVKELGLSLGTMDDADRSALAQLGVDADEVFAMFQRGGPDAAAAMDLVLDALREAESQGRTSTQVISDLFGGPGEDLGASLFALDVSSAADAMSELGTVSGETARSVETLRDNAATTGASIWSVLNTSTEDLRDNAARGEDAMSALAWVTEEAAGSAGEYESAAFDAARAQLDFDAATGGVNDELDAQSDLLETVIDGQRRLSGIAMTAVEAEGEFHQSVREASAALAENGQTLDVTTEAGLANMEALHGIAEAGWDHIDALRAQGASEADLQASMGRTREQLISSMMQFGASREEAEAYADSLGLIPSTITTTVALDTSQAGRDMSAFIRNNSGKVIGIRAQVTGIGSLEARAAGGWVAPGRADGGWVPGAPSTVDTVAWPVALPGLAGGGYLNQPLAGGEYVVNARSAGANAALLEAINSTRGSLAVSLDGTPITAVFPGLPAIQGVIRQEISADHAATAAAGRGAR